MKISTKVEFGIIALVDIALNSGKNYCFSSEFYRKNYSC